MKSLALAASLGLFLAVGCLLDPQDSDQAPDEGDAQARYPGGIIAITSALCPMSWSGLHPILAYRSRRCSATHLAMGRSSLWPVPYTPTAGFSRLI